MRNWEPLDFVGFLLALGLVIPLVGMLIMGLRTEPPSVVECRNLYSLAASRADSLEIARDGCAAFLEREK